MMKLILFHVCDFPLHKVINLTTQRISVLMKNWGYLALCMPDLRDSSIAFPNPTLPYQLSHLICNTVLSRFSYVCVSVCRCVSVSIPMTFLHKGKTLIFNQESRASIVPITNNSMSNIFCFSLLEDSLKQFRDLYNLDVFVSSRTSRFTGR